MNQMMPMAMVNRSRLRSAIVDPPSELEMQLTLLAAAREATPPLLILSLDYWDPADAAGLREIYRRQRALGHQPYVATPLLGEIIPEPG